jgi:hypothetical protein
MPNLKNGLRFSPTHETVSTVINSTWATFAKVQIIAGILLWMKLTTFLLFLTLGDAPVHFHVLFVSSFNSVQQTGKLSKQADSREKLKCVDRQSRTLHSVHSHNLSKEHYTMWPLKTQCQNNSWMIAASLEWLIWQQLF